MSDSTNPSANKSKGVNFLPNFFRTDTNKKFIQATVDQLIQPGAVKKVNGYIGRRNSKAATGSEIFIDAADQTRQNYQLEPGIVIKDTVGNVSYFKDYIDYINQLSVFGGNTSNHSRLNKQDFYSWDPHIDWDKFSNFQNYYWMPYGPDTITISGKIEPGTISTYTVSLKTTSGVNEYVFTPNGIDTNPSIKLYRGQTYKFVINSPSNPFSIRTTRTNNSSSLYVAPGLTHGVMEGVITFEIPLDAPDILYYASDTDVSIGGIFEIRNSGANSYIDIENEIIGKQSYTLANGVTLSNGMKISFSGNVIPEMYTTGSFYVEGVGTAIRLIDERTLEIVNTYSNSIDIQFDQTPFDKSPFDDAYSYTGTKEYIVINRGSNDRNPWSRCNRWVHKDVIELSATINGTVPLLDQTARAVRPIIEFEPDLKLYNYGINAIMDVDLIDEETTDAFSMVEGKPGYNIDGTRLVNGHIVVFTADTDPLVRNNLYRVQLINDMDGGTYIQRVHLEQVETLSENDVILVGSGINHKGNTYWYNGSKWVFAQQKSIANQPPLFDIVDNDMVSYGDTSVYDGSTFAGTKLFSYKVGTGTADSNLGFPLTYKNISNIGDIVFNFDIDADYFQYRNGKVIATKSTNIGYLIKTTFGETNYVNGWQQSKLLDIQAAIRIYKDSSLTNNFDLDIFDNKDDLADLNIHIFVNGILLDSNLWTLVDGVVYKQIVLTNSITTTDILTIKAYASQKINANGYYEIPLNLQNNPLNETIKEFTLGEVNDHITTINENIVPGTVGLRDRGNITPYGTRFVQHSGPLSLGIYHITNEQNNVIRSLEKARDDYTSFKRNFLLVAGTMGIDTDPVKHVDLILQEINKNKKSNLPYYFSDMVPYGASVKTDITILDGRIKIYPLNSTFLLDTLSSKSVLVYYTSVETSETIQLLYGHDYTFDSQGFVYISSSIVAGDTLTIYEFDNTSGSFIPPTPTKLGMLPKYMPKIYLDTTLVTPQMMIQGHDGSQTLAFGDYRDALLLELEKRIYNNIKVNYDPAIFDIFDIIPGYNRHLEYTIDEFNEILAPNFYKWVNVISEDYTKNIGFNEVNPMTYNYKGFPSPIGTDLPGYWRGIYRWMFDTDRPNLAPWEMLGFSDSPAWWETVYGPGPYTSDNLVLWNDLRYGYVREPGQPVVKITKLERPILDNFIPVDEQGNLLSPLTAGLATGVITQSIINDFKFGDVGPVEASWRRNSHYSFSLIIASLLMYPSKVLGVLIDRSRITKNLANQIVYKDTGLRITPSDLILPSIYVSTTETHTAGLINYIVDYILSDNLKSYNSYQYDMNNTYVKLTYRLGAFTNKDKFNLILDSKTPLSTGSLFVPQENYDIILNKSSTISKLSYSAVIVAKLSDGYEIRGYSKTKPYFTYYPWVQTGAKVNVGGISESYSNWTPNTLYVASKIVEYNNRFYRVRVTHTTSEIFDNSLYIILPALPMVGGRDAEFRKSWDRSIQLTLAYGSKLKTVQEVVDLLLGHGEWLKDQGFIFDDFNSNLNAITNWETSAKEFLFWTTQNWSSGEDKWTEWNPNVLTPFGSIVRFNGEYYRAVNNSGPSVKFITEDYVKLDGLSTVGSSVISLSPAASKITFSTPMCVVDDVSNQFNGYEILKADGTPMEINYLNSYREKNEVSYSTRSGEGIYGASFYLNQIEQVLILDNTTIFNDTLYNTSSGYRQERIKVSGYVSIDWYGSFDTPGFIYDQAKVADWEEWTDYALGDMIRHKEYYYSAKSFIVGTSTFNSSDWNKLDSKPTSQLLPNWTYKASQFNDFYSLDSDNFDSTQQTMAQHLIGYQKRQYLSNIIQDSVSEYKFYQGMILDKGTENALSKLFDVFGSSTQSSVNFVEEWAVRTGVYGANTSFDNVEIILDESLIKNNPQGYELIQTSDVAYNATDFILRLTPSELYSKPNNYDSNPWPTVTNFIPFLRSAGYVRTDEVSLIVKNISDILAGDIWDQTSQYHINSIVTYGALSYISRTNNINVVPSSSTIDWEIFDVSKFQEGDYIWAGFEGNDWNIYRYTATGLLVKNITSTDNSLTIELNTLPNLYVNDYIGIIQRNGNGRFFKIKSIKMKEIVVEFPTTILTDFTITTGTNIFVLRTQRASSIDNADSILPAKLKYNELLWTDDSGNGHWGTWKNSSVYHTSELVNLYVETKFGYGTHIKMSRDGHYNAVSDSAGRVNIFYNVGFSSGWYFKQVLAANTATQTSVSDISISFSYDSKWLAIGHPTATANAQAEAGTVTLYFRDANKVFLPVSTYTANSPSAGEKFGSNILFGDNVLYVGASGNTNGAGILYSMTFDGTNWSAPTEYIAPTLSSGDTFTYAMSLSKDGKTLVISAPGNIGTERVYVYKNGATVPSQIITNSANRFGESVTVSDNGDYLAISASLYDEKAIDQGKVILYKNNNGTYAEYQTIKSKKPELAEMFGSKISFMNNYETLVILSQNTDVEIPITFDRYSRLLTNAESLYGSSYVNDPTSIENIITTTFDNDSTKITTANINGGSVEVYDLYANYWVHGETLLNPGRMDGSHGINLGYGSGFAVGDNRIMVGAPFAFMTVGEGKTYSYRKIAGTFSWQVIHSGSRIPDVKKIKRAFLYNTITNNLITTLDVIDANQGNIPAIADQEVKFKTFYDPATYSYSSTAISGVNIDEGLAWTTSQLGMLWWDLRSAKFIESYDEDIVYRNTNWNALFPGATIDVYEWVEYNDLPSAWDLIADTEEGLALGVSGTTLYGDTIYSVVKKYDTVGKIFVNTYYFWVKNKKTVPSVTNRKISGREVSETIANPRGNGNRCIALSGANAFSLINVKSLLSNAEVALSIDYWITDVTSQNVHTEWKIISLDQTTEIPLALENKWVDSLCGKDINDLRVPDPSLSVKSRYGIENRPRQGMFINRCEALKQVIEQANRLLLTQQIVEQCDISKLETYDPIPRVNKGLYDMAVDTVSELQYISLTTPVPAKCSVVAANIEYGRIRSITIDQRGKGYIIPPYLIIKGSGQGAVARAVLNADGQVIGVDVISGGEGYVAEDTVIEIRSFSVLVRSDANAFDEWSIYSIKDFDSVTGSIIKKWVRVHNQVYDIRKYWNYADWYATGYTQFTGYKYSVNILADIFTIDSAIGDIVKVRTTSSGGWLLLEKYSDAPTIDWTQNYIVVGIQNGTIQFSPSLYTFVDTGYGYDGMLYDSIGYDSYASIELRVIFDALKHDILINALKLEYLKLFFTSIRYALSEQTYLDWVFKTSFIKAKHNLGDLKQRVTYSNDNLADFESYIEEMKPYKTKIREYISAYSKLENSGTCVTDFDLPPVFDNFKPYEIITNVVEKTVNGETVSVIEADNSAIDTYPWKNWLDNVGFSITEIRIVDGGLGYTSEPTVEIISTSGTGAKAKAFVAFGSIVRIDIITPGTGYLSAPTIVLTGGGYTQKAKCVAIIGDSVVRSNLIRMKFDRITNTYFITELQEVETFTGNGRRLQYPLLWSPDTRIGKNTVVIDGITAAKDSYTLKLVQTVTNGHTVYSGSIIFDTPPATGSTIVVTYLKDWALLSAADRIQYYYNASTGELGKDLGQLIKGVDYAGIIIDGIGDESYYNDIWDSYDSAYDDFIYDVTQSFIDTYEIHLPYIPKLNTNINVYFTTPAAKSIVGNLTMGSKVVDNIYSTAEIKVGAAITGTGVPAGTTVSSINSLYSLTMSLAATSNETGIQLSVISGFKTSTRIDDPNYPTTTNVNAVMLTWVGDGTSSIITIPGTFDVSIGDRFIIRKDSSDGSLTPSRVDYDSIVTGGDLSYVTASGLNAEDVVIDGDGLITANTSYAPEEVVPGQVVDALSIKLVERSDVRYVDIKTDMFISDGATTTFKISQKPNSKRVIVKLDSEHLNQNTGEVVKLTTILRYDTGYNVDYRNDTVTIFDTPDAGTLITIFSFSFNGTNIKDLNSVVADGKTREFVTSGMWQDVYTYLVYVDGIATDATIYRYGAHFAIRFDNAPEKNALVTYIIVGGNDQTFSITNSQRIPPTGDLTYDLLFNVGNSMPHEASMIVRSGQQILKGPYNAYFNVTDNRLSYAIDSDYIPEGAINESDVTVIIDGTVLTLSVDYTISLPIITTIVLTNTTYTKYAGKVMCVSIIYGHDYVYIPSTQNTSAQIQFTNVQPQEVEVISFYKDNLLGMQVSQVNMLTHKVLVPDSPEFYSYKNLNSGVIPLTNPIFNEKYLWVIQDGTLLTPSVDYILLSDMKTIKLVHAPKPTSEFKLITYGYNTPIYNISYMQFKDMLNRVHYKRLNLNKQTRLLKDLRQTDTLIEVEYAENFDKPDPARNCPGIIEIRGERIEFFTVQGNILSNLRRGTLGTGVPEVHKAGAYVQEIGPSENIPYNDSVIVDQLVATGSNVLPLSFIPRKKYTAISYSKNIISTIPQTQFYDTSILEILNISGYGPYFVTMEIALLSNDQPHAPVIGAYYTIKNNVNTKFNGSYECVDSLYSPMIVLTVTNTDSITNILTGYTPTGSRMLIPGDQIQFAASAAGSNPVFGNIINNKIYYVLTVNNTGTEFTISETRNGSVFALSTDSGTMVGSILETTRLTLKYNNIESINVYNIESVGQTATIKYASVLNIEGIISGTTSPYTITLPKPADIVNFTVGDLLVITDTPIDNVVDGTHTNHYGSIGSFGTNATVSAIGTNTISFTTTGGTTNVGPVMFGTTANTIVQGQLINIPHIPEYDGTYIVDTAGVGEFTITTLGSDLQSIIDPVKILYYPPLGSFVTTPPSYITRTMYGITNDIEVFVSGREPSADWKPGVIYKPGVIVNVGSYAYTCILQHTSSKSFKTDIGNWQFFVGNVRLAKVPYLVHDVNVNPESPNGDVQLDADFAVDGLSKSLRLTQNLPVNTRVTVVKRTGNIWETNADLRNDTTTIAEFLKREPGIWHTTIDKYDDKVYSFDNSVVRYDTQTVRFDQG